MKTRFNSRESASTIICALATILIISLIGANVLLNCATRYNVSAKQVKGWKEALYAAEAGGDIGFSEVRKIALHPGTEFPSAQGWSSPAPSPVPTPSPSASPFISASYYKAPTTFDSANSLTTSVTVDKFYTDADLIDYYRIRAIGTAKLFGLPRIGMDDRMDGTTRGDSLLRRIDFNYDHFKAAYGYGEALATATATSANGKGLQSVAHAQISRRVELIAVPIAAFTGGLKATGAFNGPGSAGVVDSYDSKNGDYTFVANNPASPLYSDSQNGDVSVATSTFTEGGPIYGNLTTNGGNVTHANSTVSGTIDNNVPFTMPPLVKPSYPAGYVSLSGAGQTISPTQAYATSGSPNFYVTDSLSNLTINAYTSGGKTYETRVTVVVNGDISKISIDKGVIAKIYFTGNMSVKASQLVNSNVDGAWSGVYKYDGTAMPPLSAEVSRAGALQLYGVSPASGYNTIDIGPPGSVYATVYAPDFNTSFTGNPDWYGAIVSHDFTGNGNTGFHYDKEIAWITGIATDYQLASYVEDVR
jgi:hypothetical protein